MQEEITTKVIDYVLKAHMPEASRVNKLKEIYDNHNEIMNREMSDPTKPNNKLAHPYAAFITEMAVGHAFGLPITYKSDDETLKNRIQEINDLNDEQDHNTSLATWQSICGYGVELIYSDEDSNIRYCAMNPAEVVVVYDNSVQENVQFAIRCYEVPNIEESDNVKYHVEVYTTDKKFTYEKEEDKYTLLDEEELNFGDVPISIYANNNDFKGDFEKIIPLIDAYDKVQSDTANDFEYFTDAYLVISGATVDPDTALDLKKQRVMNFPESEGDAKFLIKEINDTALENYKSRVKDDIHKFSFVPDVGSDKFVSSLSGEALKYKFSALNNICKTKHNKFKKGLMRRIRMICNFLSIKEAAEYTSIVPVFTLNMPKNQMDMANLVNMLYGKLPLETLISWLEGVDDPAFEIEKLKEEGVITTDLDQVNSQVMPRKEFIVKHFGVDEATATKWLEQIATEREILEESFMATDTTDIEEVEIDGE